VCHRDDFVEGGEKLSVWSCVGGHRVIKKWNANLRPVRFAGTGAQGVKEKKTQKRGTLNFGKKNCG